ncbi:cellulose binding domain-containing protein [Actinoplanes sp. NPDC049596]|uniref:GH12 family glycosyl hydrolase domain-containing protein n=1 Tax=unclassified Actinoplanes TaxID=2626549 RepID=UPI00344A709B
MRRILRAGLAAGLLATAALTTFAVAGPAEADTTICEQYGTATVGGRYIVMNNRWGTTAQQCINVTSTGFSVTSQQGTGNTSGAPVSYPAIYLGCHYTKCSPGTNLPIRVSNISSATSRISYSYVQGATYDAAYDIWLDPAPKTDGVSQQEIMIWFNRQGSIQPIGSVVGTANIGGRSWQVWQGSNGSNAVISYVAPSPITSWSFSVLDFIRDVQNRGAITNAWYLTSIQAGFEPWIGGAGLAVTDFAAEVNGGGIPTSPPPSTTTPPPASSACRITYATNTWNTGLTANVTVTNTGSTALNGWTLGFTLPSGQTITGSWNAALTGASGAITARNNAYNGTLAPNASTSFGFQATHAGNSSAPAAFTLNGTTCTTA